MSRTMIIVLENGQPHLKVHPDSVVVLEKMSKSKDNVVTIDEVCAGVKKLEPNFEFVTLPPQYAKVDYKEIPIYKNQVDGYFYTVKNYGHIPVLIADISDKYIPRFPNGPQHADKLEVIAALEE